MLPDPTHGRPLTAAERTRLDDLARRLSEDDPRLAQALRDGVTTHSVSRRAEVWLLAMGAAILVLLAASSAGRLARWPWR